MKPLRCILPLLAFTALPLSAATNTVRVYFIGNSVTDTARWADLVLPATSSLEHDDLYKSYGSYCIQRAAAAGFRSLHADPTSATATTRSWSGFSRA